MPVPGKIKQKTKHYRNAKLPFYLYFKSFYLVKGQSYNNRNSSYDLCLKFSHDNSSDNMVILLSLFDSKFICFYQMQDVYFDDDSAEVVISSLRLGDDQGRSVFILS